MNDNEQNLTLDEAAAQLRMAPSSLRRRVHRGDVPAVKLAGSGRLLFRKQDLADAMVPVEVKEEEGHDQ